MEMATGMIDSNNGLFESWDEINKIKRLLKGFHSTEMMNIFLSIRSSYEPEGAYKAEGLEEYPELVECR